MLRAIFRVPCACCGVSSVFSLYAVWSVCFLCAVRSGYWVHPVCVCCVLCLAPSLHHSVTQSRTCSAFISHRNSVPGCVYDTISSRFRPFSGTPGLIIQCPSHSCFITFMETPSTRTRYNFVSFSSLLLCPGADYTMPLAHPLYNVLGNPDL